MATTEQEGGDATSSVLFPDKEQFLSKLYAFMEDRGTPIIKTRPLPTVGKRELDLFLIFNEVTKRGGFERVCNDKKWKEVVDSYNVPITYTTASYALRQNYKKYLLPFEIVFFHHLPDPIIEQRRKEELDLFREEDIFVVHSSEQVSELQRQNIFFFSPKNTHGDAVYVSKLKLMVNEKDAKEKQKQYQTQYTENSEKRAASAPTGHFLKSRDFDNVYSTIRLRFLKAQKKDKEDQYNMDDNKNEPFFRGQNEATFKNFLKSKFDQEQKILKQVECALATKTNYFVEWALQTLTSWSSLNAFFDSRGSNIDKEKNQVFLRYLETHFFLTPINFDAIFQLPELCLSIVEKYIFQIQKITSKSILQSTIPPKFDQFIFPVPKEGEDQIFPNLPNSSEKDAIANKFLARKLFLHAITFIRNISLSPYNQHCTKQYGFPFLFIILAMQLQNEINFDFREEGVDYLENRIVLHRILDILSNISPNLSIEQVFSDGIQKYAQFLYPNSSEKPDISKEVKTYLDLFFKMIQKSLQDSKSSLDTNYAELISNTKSGKLSILQMESTFYRLKITKQLLTILHNLVTTKNFENPIQNAKLLFDYIECPTSMIVDSVLKPLQMLNQSKNRKIWEISKKEKKFIQIRNITSLLSLNILKQFIIYSESLELQQSSSSGKPNFSDLEKANLSIIEGKFKKAVFVHDEMLQWVLGSVLDVYSEELGASSYSSRRAFFALLQNKRYNWFENKMKKTRKKRKLNLIRSLQSIARKKRRIERPDEEDEEDIIPEVDSSDSEQENEPGDQTKKQNFKLDVNTYIDDQEDAEEEEIEEDEGDEIISKVFPEEPDFQIVEEENDDQNEEEEEEEEDMDKELQEEEEEESAFMESFLIGEIYDRRQTSEDISPSGATNPDADEKSQKEQQEDEEEIIKKKLALYDIMESCIFTIQNLIYLKKQHEKLIFKEKNASMGKIKKIFISEEKRQDLIRQIMCCTNEILSKKAQRILALSEWEYPPTRTQPVVVEEKPKEKEKEKENSI